MSVSDCLSWEAVMDLCAAHAVRELEIQGVF